MSLKSYSEFIQKIFEDDKKDSFADWANMNNNFKKLADENIKPPVEKLVYLYSGGVGIGYNHNRKTHNIVSKVSRTLIDSQEDFEIQVHKFVDTIKNMNYDFIKDEQYDFYIKSKNCHFIFTYDTTKKYVFVVTIVPQKGTDCVDHFEID